MNTDPKRHASSGSEDPWANLAEDLFGIDLSKSQPTEDLVRDDEQLPLPIPKSRGGQSRAAEVKSTAEPVSEAEAPVEQAQPPVEATPAARPAAKDAPRRERSRRSVRKPDRRVSNESESDEAEAVEAVAGDADEDSYWDALEDWDWGEGMELKSVTSEDESADQEAVEEAAAAATSERDAEWEATVRARRQEYLEVSDFGAGVDEDFEPAPQRKPPRSAQPAASKPRRSESGPRRPAPSKSRPPAADDDFGIGAFPEEAAADIQETAAEEPAARESDEEREARPKRRRRRRRRSSDKTGPATVSGDDESREESPRRRRRPEPEDEVAEDEVAEDEDELAWSEPESPDEPLSEDDDDARPRRRRRRRRRRSGDAERPGFETPTRSESEEESEGEDDTDTETDAADDESMEDAARPAGVYRNIPTWEQAISYLLDPGQVGVRKIDVEFEDDDGEGRESPRSSGRRGRRRRSKS